MAFGQSKPKECGVEKVTRIIACKGATRPIGAFQTGRKTNDQKFSVTRTEGRNWRMMPALVTFLIFMAEFGETRAKRTGWNGGTTHPVQTMLHVCRNLGLSWLEVTIVLIAFGCIIAVDLFVHLR